MKSYKDSSYQERVSRASEAKKKALDNLRAKPPLDEAVVAERQAARLKRDAVEAEKRAAKMASQQSAKEARVAEKAAKAEQVTRETKAVPAPLSEAEKKLARDARYAARKSRKQDR